MAGPVGRAAPSSRIQSHPKAKDPQPGLGAFVFESGWRDPSGAPRPPPESKAIPKPKTPSRGWGPSSLSRDGGIRTHDLFVPNEARYQAAPHPEEHRRF